MGVSVAIGMITGSLFLSFGLSVVGLGVLILLRRRIEEPVHNERDLLIDAKSSTATLQALLVGTALLGSALIFLDMLSSYTSSG